MVLTDTIDAAKACTLLLNACELLQGNSTGDVYVFDTVDGKRMTHVAPIKVSAPVRACGISPDCRHLLAVLGNGFIFRFEYRKPDDEVICHAKCICMLHTVILKI